MSTTPPPRPECYLTEALTAREEEILPLFAEGLSNREIADRLLIGATTVKWYNQRIFDKFGLDRTYRKRRWAVYCARQLGVLAGSDGAVSAPETIDSAPGDNPYKGLDAFYQDDAETFFGREALTEALVHRLGENGSTPRFLAVVGPSGSGKSSVVRAGLLPALAHNDIPGSAQWIVTDMVPRSNPFYELEIALRRVAVKPQPDLLDLLQRDSYGLARAVPLILPEGSPLLLIIDQFEELFTLVEDSKLARRFMDLIYAAVIDPRSPVRVIMTLRADFLDRPLLYPDFSWLIKEHNEMVVPLTPDELERAISLPAQQAHVQIEAGVVAKLVAEANEQPGALPLLQFALTELYDNHVEGAITLQHYEEIGGLQKTLAAQADKIYEDLDETQREATRQLFLRLITLGEGSEDTRRRASLTELSTLDTPTETMEYVVQYLTANRLLTTDIDPTTKTPSVEVAHETLIREWNTLRNWLDESRNDIRMQRLLNHATTQWQASAGDDSYLLRGSRLTQFDGWAAGTDIALTADERLFLETSVIEQQRRNRRLRLIRNVALATAVVIAVVMGFLALSAVRERDNAIKSEAEAVAALDVAQRSSLAFAATTALDRDEIDLAIALAVESAKGGDALLPETLRALERISLTKGPTHIIPGGDTFCNAEVSQDGRYLIRTDCKGLVNIWDTTTGELAYTLTDVAAEDGGAQLSPDNSRLATLDPSTMQISVWDVETGTNISRFDSEISSDKQWWFDFAWDASTIMTFELEIVPNTDRWHATTLRLYDVTQGTLIRAYEFDVHWLFANFSHDGSLGVIGGWDDPLTRERYRAYVFEVETGAIIETYEREAHTDVIDANYNAARFGPASIGFSDDMREIFIGGLPNYIIDRESGTDRLVLEEGVIYFQRRLREQVALFGLGAATDDLFYVADTLTGDVELIGPSANMWMGYDRDTVITLVHGANNNVEVWDLGVRDDDHRILAQSRAWTANAFNPDGTQIAIAVDFAGAGENYVDVLDVNTGDRKFRLAEPDLRAFDMAWSPDGAMIAAGTFEAGVVIWDAETGDELQRLTDITEPLISTVQFTHDSQYIVAAHGSPYPNLFYETLPELVVWDANTGEVINRIQLPAGDDLRNWGVGISDIAIHPQQYIAYVGVDEDYEHLSTYLVDLMTGEITHTFPEEIEGDTAFTPDGNRLVVGSTNGWIYVLSVETGEIERSWKSLDSYLWGARVSNDGRYIVTGSGWLAYESALTLWDFETGEFIRRFIGHNPQSFISDIDFSPDGTRLASSAIDGTTRLWNIDTQSTLDWVLNNRFVREFSCAEREIYRIEPPCE